MRKSPAFLIASMLLCSAVSTFAADEYNTVPAGNKQYAACLTAINKSYDGGNEKSPIAGQNKAQAFCSCMWNETPEDFKGSLAQFSESAKGKATNKICEKYSDWSN